MATNPLGGRKAADIRTEYHYAEWRVPVAADASELDAQLLYAALQAAYTPASAQHRVTGVTLRLAGTEDRHDEPYLLVRADFQIV